MTYIHSYRLCGLVSLSFAGADFRHTFSKRDSIVT